MNQPQFVVGFFKQLGAYASQGQHDFLVIIAGMYKKNIHCINAFDDIQNK
jgi:hypothetical protein